MKKLVNVSVTFSIVYNELCVKKVMECGVHVPKMKKKWIFKSWTSQNDKMDLKSDFLNLGQMDQ